MDVSEMWRIAPMADGGVLVGESAGVRRYRSVVSTSGTTYTAPIAVAESTTIKAIAVLVGVSSVVASFAYTIAGVAGVSLFGAPFDGFERGYSCTVMRNINWVPSIGGTQQGIPVAPAAFDAWEIDAELWIDEDRAEAFEAVFPPYGTPTSNSIVVPPRFGTNTFAGLAPQSSSSGGDTYVNAELVSCESQGRKGPRLNLIGYRIVFRLYCNSAGVETNPATTPTTTAPDWLNQKFTAHQIQDWSAQGVVAEGTAGPSDNYRPVQHGRRRDINMNLDHLSQDRVDNLVAWYRGVRHSKATISIDRGPTGQGGVTVKLVDLKLQRTAAGLWDGTLEMSVA